MTMNDKEKLLKAIGFDAVEIRSKGEELSLRLFDECAAFFGETPTSDAIIDATKETIIVYSLAMLAASLVSDGEISEKLFIELFSESRKIIAEKQLRDLVKKGANYAS
jgi:hypothetical protein